MYVTAPESPVQKIEKINTEYRKKADDNMNDIDDEDDDGEIYPLTASLEAPHLNPHATPRDAQPDEEPTHGSPYLAMLPHCSKTHFKGVLVPVGHNQKMNDYVAMKFLHFFSLTGRRGTSALAAGVSRDTIKNYELDNEEFAQEIEEARQDFIEWMEREMIRRGFEGVLEPIVQGKNPKVVAYKRVFSDRLAELMARRHAPEHYGNKIELDAKVSGGVLVVGTEASPESEEYPTETIEDVEFTELDPGDDPDASNPNRLPAPKSESEK